MQVRQEVKQIQMPHLSLTMASLNRLEIFGGVCGSGG